MLPNRSSLFYTVKQPVETNGDRLPSLSKRNAPERGSTANLTRVNFSMDSRGPNKYYERLTRSYTNPEIVYNQTGQPNVAKSYEDPGQFLLRQGRLGASWRHVKQCTGNLGNHICFIDGAVKQNDVVQNPPYGCETKNDSGGKFTYYSYGPKSAVPRKVPPITCRSNHNKFNQHAKSGFRYWYSEKPAMSSSKPKRTIHGQLIKYGIGC